MSLKDVINSIRHNPKARSRARSPFLRKNPSNLSDKWGQREARKFSLPVFFFLGSFIFFAVSIFIVIAGNILGVDRSISKDKVDIAIQGVTNISIGEQARISFRVLNRNPVDIRSAEIIIQYPEGVYEIQNGNILRQVTIPIAEGIPSNEFTEVIRNPYFLGKEGDIRSISVQLEYKTEGSYSVIRVNSPEHKIILKNPIVIIPEPVTNQLISGKQATITFKVISSAKQTLNTVYARAKYPKGFTPEYANPTFTSLERDTWEIRNLAPGEERTISISGNITGEAGLEQILKVEAFVVPLFGPDTTKAVSVAQTSKVISIQNPFIKVSLELDSRRNRGQHIIVNPGDSVRGTVYWENNDVFDLEDVVIEVVLSGSGLDLNKVTTGGGIFDGDRNRIFWDKRSKPSLSFVRAREKGSFKFSFGILRSDPLLPIKNKEAGLSVNVYAVRTQRFVNDVVRGVAVASVKARSALFVDAKTQYHFSSIQNTGPLPPKVGEETTYSLSYFIKNDGNALRNLELTIPLTKDVVFKNKAFGVRQGEVKYDEDTHTISVTILSLPFNGQSATRSIELQISVIPTIPSIGKTIALTKEAKLEVFDEFTRETLVHGLKSLSTARTSEPRTFEESKVSE